MDAVDKAQAHAEWLEQFRMQHRRKHVMRASDFCISCGETIEPARLKAVPAATRCYYCQADQDHQDRLYG